MIRSQVFRSAAAGFALVLTGLLAFPASAAGIERVVSPGGIEAWLVRDHSVPVLSVEFAFEGGSALDPAGKEGLARLAATLLDEGAGPLDSQAFQRRLEDQGISLGFRAGPDAVYGSLKALTETEDEAAELLRLALAEPRMEAEAVERMRTAALTRIHRDETDPNALAQRAFSRAAYPDHPYGRPASGTAESVKAITADDLRGFVASRFARKNLTVGVAGDITPERLGRLLDRVFGGLSEDPGGPAVAEATPRGAGRTLVVDSPIAQSIVLMGQPGIKRSDPDWYAAVVMNHILGGGGFGSRLMEEVREKRGLSYGVYSHLVPSEHSALVMAGGSTANANAGQMIGLMKAEWARMAGHGPTAAELEDAKSFLTGSFALQFTTTDQIAATLLQLQRDDLGIDFLDRRNALIAAIGLEDVRRAAARILAPEGLLIVVVGQPQGVNAARTEAPNG